MTAQEILGWLKGDTQNVQGQEYPLRKRDVLIGRGTQSDVQLSDPKISRKHARLRFGEDSVLLEDLGSAHGTLVNGERGDCFVLKDGDVICLGDTLLVFKASPDTMATLMSAKVGMPVRPPAAQVPTPIAPVQSSASATDGAKKRSGTMMFFLGLIPVLLIGIAAILLFIFLGGEPEPYATSDSADEPDAILPTEPLPSETQAVAQSTEEVVPVVEAVDETPAGPHPELVIRPRDSQADGNVVDLSKIVTFNESESSIELYVYDGQISAGQDLGLNYSQCAIDEETLIDNFKHVTFNFIVEGLSVGLDELAFSEWDRGDRYCYLYDGVIIGPPVGTYEILWKYEQSEEYFDGFDTYVPGVVETLYRVEVVDFGSTAEASGDLAEAGPRVTLHVGDARFFSVPPEAVAYANTQHAAAPEEISVMENCGSSGCWRYNEWLAMGEPGQYIESESTVSTTAVGVQLWGDQNDGWARVLVDGEEVWLGEMRGADNQWPGGAFVRYLEISGLAPGLHTLRFEPTGEGGSVTMYFFGIGEVAP